jgi:hypothetical protein
MALEAVVVVEPMALQMAMVETMVAVLAKITHLVVQSGLFGLV